MGEALGLWHVSALAALFLAILGASAAFVFSWRVCEVLNASQNPTMKGILVFAALDTECL